MEITILFSILSTVPRFASVFGSCNSFGSVFTIHVTRNWGSNRGAWNFSNWGRKAIEMDQFSNYKDVCGGRGAIGPRAPTKKL